MGITRGLRFAGGLLLALVATGAAAQDANYWALQYDPSASSSGAR